MPNFRARKEKLRKTNVKLRLLVFYFLNQTFLNLNVGLKGEIQPPRSFSLAICVKDLVVSDPPKKNRKKRKRNTHGEKKNKKNQEKEKNRTRRKIWWSQTPPKKEQKKEKENMKNIRKRKQRNKRNNRKKRRIWWSQTPNSVSANKIRPEGNAVIQKIKKGLLPPFAQPRKGKSFFRGSPNPLPPKLPISPEILRGSKQRKLRKNTEKLVFSQFFLGFSWFFLGFSTFFLGFL